MTTLYEISQRYQQGFLKLADSDLPDDVINDTLEGMEGELIEKGMAVSAFALNLEAEIGAVRIVENRIRERRIALENKHERLLEYLKKNMAECGITSIKSNDGSFEAKLYPGRDKAVVIEDENQIPGDYKREIPARQEPDKRLIAKAIEDGFDVPGARIIRKDRLVIK